MDSPTAASSAQVSSGEARRGEAFGGEAFSREPDWPALGFTCVRNGDIAGAAQCFERVVRSTPRDADAWHNLGTALRRLGKREAAFTALKNALLLDPTRADTYLNLGNLLVEAEQLDDAFQCFERAARHNPRLAQARSKIGAQLSARGQPQKAADTFRDAIALDDTHADGWLGLGRVFEDLGDAAGALTCYRNLLAREPRHPAALGHYLPLLKTDAPEGLLESARSLCADSAMPDEGRALIGYGLAKYHDRRREADAAASAARAANSARRRVAGPLDREALRTRVECMIGCYTADFFAQRRHFGIATGQPVFIVGLPRSGTTLTEQILAAHPLLHGAGELPDLPRIAGIAAAAKNASAHWRAAATLDVQTSRQYAYDYLRALRNGAPRERLRISDKAPFNFFQLAFVALLFPQARIIHCGRNARDNALSIWMENFNPDQHYATDFGDLAVLRACYEQLMAHWRTVLPLRVHELDYEQLVADTDGEARRLCAFLGVPWDERCLDFHANARAVQTPSRWQVREKVYTRSVQRWRAYAEHLPELLAAFPDTPDHNPSSIQE